ncbi:hypothetical protein CCHR01_19080 [Colletotrichum chrysophilum]|uniref:Uncharacterized protein n=1 Tax=Colletotrichum chrysophilum TaxID=1836956 RepID=A0AAD9EAT2_9PEZI|nr:hypothetical protein CCHR01_19080 [Colletotrichum chrysophilum]
MLPTPTPTWLLDSPATFPVVCLSCAVTGFVQGPDSRVFLV